jgi:hypothetical protein
MWRTILSSALCAAVSFCSATTFGATLIPSVKVGATYDSAGNLQSSTGLINDGAPHILRFDFFSTMSGLGPNQSFGAEVFDIQLSGGLTRSSLLAPGPAFETPKPNFVFNNPAMVNIASGTSHDPLLNFFPDSGNLGVSATDLVGLEADLGIPTSASIGNTVDATTFAPVPDPRLNIGVATPFQFGSLYLDWDGNSIGTLKVVHHQFDVFDTRLQKYPLQAVQDLPNGSLEVPDTLFTVCEPTGCALAVFGGIGFLYFSWHYRIHAA